MPTELFHKMITLLGNGNSTKAIKDRFYFRLVDTVKVTFNISDTLTKLKLIMPFINMLLFYMFAICFTGSRIRRRQRSSGSYSSLQTPDHTAVRYDEGQFKLSGRRLYVSLCPFT